jgi:site-specific DNA recombinase
LSALREAARDGHVSLIICFAIDRLSRDPAHLAVLLLEAEHFGVRVEFVAEPADQSPARGMLRLVLGYAAQIEHENMRERIMRGRMARPRAGRLLAVARPRYGYRWRDSTRSALDEDPSTGPVVRWMFAREAAGATIRSVAARLTTTTTPTPLPQSAYSSWTRSTRVRVEDCGTARNSGATARQATCTVISTCGLRRIASPCHMGRPRHWSM